MKTHVQKFVGILLLATAMVVLVSCGGINKAMQNTDLDYRYEAAKQYYARGKYGNATLLLGDVINGLKGTERGGEALFLYGMCKFEESDYDEANQFLKRYTRSYPQGTHAEEARYYAARSLYLSIPNVNLDQTDTYNAITEFQEFLDVYPDSRYSPSVRDLIFEMQDKLILKQYNAAKLYYNLGDYFGNCTMGGSNYQACIITAENAIKDYPYTSRKEEFAILILRAKYRLAEQSVAEKRKERSVEANDEYFGFHNEFPNSKYLDEAKRLYDKHNAVVESDE